MMVIDSVGARAGIVFALFNVILITTVVIAILIAPTTGQVIWMQGIVALIFMAAEAVIVARTIAEPLLSWIRWGSATPDARAH